MVLKRKEIVAASLVLLIGIAGYLNWSYQDSIQVLDGESYIETGKKLGEAQYVSNPAEDVEGEVQKEEGEAQQTANTQESAQGEDAAPQQTESEKKTVEVAEDKDGTFFEQARIDREAARSKSVEILNQTAANESFDSEIRKKAGEKLLGVSSDIENENAIESLAMSKGYAEVCAYVNEGMARIMVRHDNFSEADVVKITDIATEILNLSANCVKIVEVK